jgi:hypothetical protein
MGEGVNTHQIKEALALFGNDQLPDDPTSVECDAYEAAAAAARAYVDLVENRQEIWWCEEHDASGPRSDICEIAYFDNVVESCRMVPRLLVPEGPQ